MHLGRPLLQLHVQDSNLVSQQRQAPAAPKSLTCSSFALRCAAAIAPQAATRAVCRYGPDAGGAASGAMLLAKNSMIRRSSGFCPRFQAAHCSTDIGATPCICTARLSEIV